MPLLHLRAAALLLAMGALPTAAAAQTVTGRVVDGRTERPVVGASVVLVDPAGDDVLRVESGPEGRFTLPVPGAAPHTLRVEALGYAALRTGTVRPEPQEVVEVEVRLGVEALEVEPLVVTARSRMSRYPAFESRLQAGRQSGRGFFLVRADLERVRGLPLSNVLLRIPGAPLRRDARGRVWVGRSARTSGMTECSPGLFVDGVRMNPSAQPVDDLANPIELEGVEVYRSQSEVPAELGGSSLCGALALWTRQGEKPPAGGSWIPTIIMSSLIGALLVLSLVR